MEQLLRSLPVGAPLFHGITAQKALAVLREILHELGTPGADFYRTHDLRRGHADDLRLSGCSLLEFLEAGEWSSPAFLKYLEMATLDRDVVMSAHVEESDGEDT